jgi:pheromone alpha factor receptor
MSISGLHQLFSLISFSQQLGLGSSPIYPSLRVANFVQILEPFFLFHKFLPFATAMNFVMASSNGFDPFSQNVTFLMKDGEVINLGVSAIDNWYLYSIKTSINYGAQLGACFVMFFATALLTRESQRGKPVFILNLVSLFLGTLRALLLAVWFTSPWSEFYSYFSGDVSRVGRATIATSVAGTVIPVLMTLTVNASLVLQAQTVCKVMRRNYYYGTCALAFLVLLLAISFRFTQCITNSMAIMSDGTYYSKLWIRTGALATETISIWFFSAIFTWKLFWTIMTRRKHGWNNLNPMQILMIMSGCTMVIPCPYLFYLTRSDP